ncbi:unnamed protein product [Paramecium primaurelia]|uniref:Uncharacterized protein n=1 Tax=Paramecium primaurelia TaxID=5886 RepID=A0A8S1MLX7_PARPR|nr:unnamed protein product [Paramecium primaurelia]
MDLTSAYFSDFEYFKLYQPIHKTYNKNKQNNMNRKIRLNLQVHSDQEKYKQNYLKLEWHLSGQPTEEMKNKLQKVVVCKIHEEIQKMKECVAIGILYFQMFCQGSCALDADHAAQTWVITDQIIKIVDKQLSIMMPIHLSGEVSEPSKFLLKQHTLVCRKHQKFANQVIDIYRCWQYY